MSGNLKILVHKSWHVWKRENREKVARDERNFKEENERKDERERNLLQEKNLEDLQSAQEQHQQNSSDTPAAEEPFRLFGDIEELDKKNKEIKEQNQARKDKEFNDKKKSGEAPWALGEGAAEKIGSVVPYWYTKSSSNTNSSATSSSSSSSSLPFNSEWGGRECEEDAILKREELRKIALDPMTGILKPGNKIRDDSKATKSDQIDTIRIKKELTDSEITRIRNNSQSEKGSNLEENKSRHKHSRKSEKNDDTRREKRRKSSTSASDSDSEKRIKRERHSRSDSSSDKGSEYDKNKNKKRTSNSNNSSSNNNNSSSSSSRSKIQSSEKIATKPSSSSSTSFSSSVPFSNSGSSSGFGSGSSSSTAALRQRRMEREYAERKRATQVLARVDIFGPLNALGLGGLPDGREQRYNQQFHPHIAR